MITSDSPSYQIFWIGLTDETTEGNWKWITGESVSYTNWRVGEPNDASEGEDYVVINSNGQWSDNGGPTNPSLMQYYICE